MYIYLLNFHFGDNFSKKPANLYSKKKTKKTKWKKPIKLNQNETKVDCLINFPKQILMWNLKFIFFSKANIYW